MSSRYATASKAARRLVCVKDGKPMSIDLTDNDLVFITNGGCVENSTLGDQNSPAPFNAEIKEGGGWDMWRKIAAQDPAFGHPDKFCSDPEKSNWMSATVTTLDDKIPPYVQKICKRDPFSGERRDRRHRDRKGLQLAAELDVQPSAAVPRAAQGAAGGLDIRPVHRPSRQLCKEADARMHR